MLFIQARRHGGSGNTPPTRIVIHGTVSPCRTGQARATAAYFQKVTRPASAHYVVDPGEIVQCLTDDTIGYHAPPNLRSIGVELCDPQTGPGSRWADDDHEAMLTRAAGLVRDLAAKYGIPIRRLSIADLKAGRKGLCGHVDVSNTWHQTTHVDPGPDFPWPHFLDLVNGDDMAITDDDAKKIALEVWRYNQGGAKRQAWAYIQAAAADQTPALAAAVKAQLPVTGAPTQAQLEQALRTVLGSLDE